MIAIFVQIRFEIFADKEQNPICYLISYMRGIANKIYISKQFNGVAR